MSDIAFRTHYSDAAKRCSEIITATAIIENEAKNYAERWVAIRLSDGGSDGAVYPSRQQAIAHQPDEYMCCYILVPLAGMNEREAELFMAYNRRLYDKGFRMPDPQSITPATNEGFRSQMRQLSR
jgi:hypothetical protein